MKISKFTIFGQFYILPYVKITHDIFLNGEYEFIVGWMHVGISLSYDPGIFTVKINGEDYDVAGKANLQDF